jgi:hypothetical protein
LLGKNQYFSGKNKYFLGKRNICYAKEKGSKIRDTVVWPHQNKTG